MKYLFILLVPAAFFILNFYGCIPSKPTEEVEILPSERLINKLEVNRRRIRSFEGNGIMTIKSREFNNSAPFRVVLQKPDSVYLTIMGPFGIELAQALVTEDNFIFYDALNNTVYKGEVTDAVLSEIFKIDIPFPDIMDAFIGSVNLTENLYRAPAEYKVIYDEYVLTYIDSMSNISKTFYIDVRELGIKNYIVSDKSGNRILEGRYSEFKVLETVAVPYKITVRDIRENQMITIDYRNMKVNQPGTKIYLQVPEDASIVKW